MNMEDRVAKVTPGLAEEAELWLVRTSDPGCTAEQREAFKRWREAGAANETAWRQAEHLWSLGEEALAGDLTLRLAMRRAARPTPPRPQRWWLPALAVAATLVAAALLLPRWLPHPATEYTTAVGQRRTVVLPDGSSMVLDTNSDVRVSYGDAARRVDLLRGRAQFHVHGDLKWPFVVHAQGGTVTAVGTWFQVRLDHDKADVTLLEGKLAIATRHDGTTRHAWLMARQQLEFDRAGNIGPVRPADMPAAEGWTAGKLFVDDWRLADLLAEMNRYSTTQLVLSDPALGGVRISGVFSTDDQQTLLQVLQQGWSIDANRVAPDRVVLSRR